MRKYRLFEPPCPALTEEDIEKAFALLGKSDYEKQHVDCGACGSNTCYNMARKIALGVNIPFNCMVKAMEDAKREHEENLTAREQVALMEKTREADERMRVMLDATPTATILFDLGGNVIDCNSVAMQFMGFENKEEFIVGFLKRLAESTPSFQPDGMASVPAAVRFAKAIKEGFVRYSREIILNGTHRYLNVELKKIPYDTSFAIVVYIFDMTDIRERERELAHTREQQIAAESASQAKTEFLSSMSHEIRTPMNAILGITEIQLQNESLAPEMREALGKIYNAGDLLLSIINDILDLSKIEAGKLELMPSEYSLASLVNDVVILNMMQIGSKNIKFKLTVDENTPSTLFGDELRIKQILNNLLSNAIKYTEKGTVKLSVFTETKNEAEVVLVFQVIDTGLGMTEEQVHQLFDKFTRFHVETNRATEGIGLGMNITQNLVRLMNGEIFVKSQINKGTEFTIRLPQKKTGTKVLGEKLAKNLQDFRVSDRKQVKMAQIVFEPMPDAHVLVVDDVESNLYVAKGLLAPYGLLVDTVASGYAAIDKIKEGNEYDVIFMDHMMPKMDGLETTKIIRGLGYERPIVALTANAVSGQSEIFLANGFDGFVPKPIDVRLLNA
ncbi:MAG: ATP-binding protein, partial [Planctomycetaceae bacterium]|nr:ATP-binding protein [Planctomycetaceae bacterium]